VFDLHDLLKGYVYNRLSSDEKRASHEMAATYFGREENIQSGIEAIYHLLKMGNVRDAKKVLVKKSNEIINSHYLDSVFDLLEHEAWSELETSQLLEVSLIKIEVLFQLGKWDKATEEIFNATLIAKNNDLGVLELRCNVALLKSDFYKSRWRECIVLGRKVNSQAEKEGAKQVIANANYWMGASLTKTGRIQEAIEIFKDGLSLSQSLKEDDLALRYRIGLAALFDYTGDFSDALDNHMNVLSHVVANKNLFYQAIVHNNQGFQYLLLNQFEEALNHLKKAKAISKDIGFPYNQVNSTINMAYIYAKQGKIVEAQRACEEAEPIAKRMGFDGSIASIRLAQGVMWTRLQAWDRAEECFKESLDSFGKLQIPHDAARVYYEYFEMLNYRGLTESATTHLKKASAIYEQLRNRPKLKEMEEALSSIEEKNNK